MTITNEYERDMNDTSFLGRPGRVDLRVFQNTPDAGDGYPGLQRAFRNYLHEGGMENDLDVNSHDIINIGELVFPSATIHSSGTEIHIHPNTGNEDGNLILHPVGSNTASVIFIRNSVTANYGDFIIKVDGAIASLESAQGGSGTKPTTLNINQADWDNINIGDASATITMNAVGITVGEWGQIANINAVTITNGQWVYVGGADQPVKQADSPTFVGLTLSADLVTTSTIDGIDVSDLKDSFDTHTGSTGASHTYIDQSVVQTSSPTFVGLTLSADLVTTSTIDGIDVSAIKLNSMPTAADGDITANTQKITDVVDCTLDQDAATKKYVDDNDVIYTASDDLMFSNDTERTQNSQSWVKLKEITSYVVGNIRLYWEHYRQTGADGGGTKVYLNGVPLSTEREATESYTSETHDMTVKVGDLIQIWGRAWVDLPADRSIYVRYQRIKFIDFVTTGGY